MGGRRVPEFRSFEEFWPFYLTQHRNRVCRALHFLGTTSALGCVAYAVTTRQWGLILLAPVIGYAFAWIGHFGFEGNRPATFGHPAWSLRADLRMYFRLWAFRKLS